MPSSIVAKSAFEVLGVCVGGGGEGEGCWTRVASCSEGACASLGFSGVAMVTSVVGVGVMISEVVAEGGRGSNDDGVVSEGEGFTEGAGLDMVSIFGGGGG